MSKQDRIKMYMDYLVQEGYHPTIDSDGDLQFKMEGKTYCIVADEKDEMYFRLVYFNFWSIESGEELARVLLAANYATMATKVAKVYVRSDNQDTCAAIEMFIDPPSNFRSVFSRSLSALRASVGNFVDKIKEQSK